MLIWKGAGILVPLIAVVCFGAVAVLVSDSFDTNYGIVISQLVAGAVIWVAAGLLSRGETRTLVDPETNEPVVLKKTHSFFFIPMKYWAFILPALSLLFLVA